MFAPTVDPEFFIIKRDCVQTLVVRPQLLVSFSLVQYEEEVGSAPEDTEAEV
jgi:hypothetical protein